MKPRLALGQFGIISHFLGSATIGTPALWNHQKWPLELLLAVTETLPATAKALSTTIEALLVPSKAPIEAASKALPAPKEAFQPMHHCSCHRLQYENKLVEHKELLIT